MHTITLSAIKANVHHNFLAIGNTEDSAGDSNLPNAIPQRFQMRIFQSLEPDVHLPSQFD